VASPWATNENQDGYDLRFRSSEYSSSYYRPKLVVTYKRQFNYVFYLKDHLGNIRVTVDKDGEVLGYDDYYPFGLQMPGRSSNTANPNHLYKYSSKELDEEIGLEWYYFGARYYDPVIARWLAADPLAVLSSSLTPYNYTRNNPLNFIDPDGLKEIKVRDYAQSNLINYSYKNAFNYNDNGSWTIHTENSGVCNEIVALAYSGAGYNTFPGQMAKQVEWFENKNWYTTNPNAGEIGDAIYFGNATSLAEGIARHAAIIIDVQTSNGQRVYQLMWASSTRRKSRIGSEYYSAAEWAKLFNKSFHGIGSVTESIFSPVFSKAKSESSNESSGETGGGPPINPAESMKKWFLRKIGADHLSPAAMWKLVKGGE